MFASLIAETTCPPPLLTTKKPFGCNCWNGSGAWSCAIGPSKHRTVRSWFSATSAVSYDRGELRAAEQEVTIDASSSHPERACPGHRGVIAAARRAAVNGHQHQQARA